jgi:hypothetical protein
MSSPAADGEAESERDLTTANRLRERTADEGHVRDGGTE